ncbi:hypothetical protein NDK37_17550 [Xanthomonas citri pv. glycines]|uniref:hypothetical protein n=1 Tax=Xanthomonas citri TaxID=346 RepID=UPI0013DF1A66|nr:hypothetical protein [Xanthomonas citri]WLA22372.1 hypothetical protein NDK37_17550 [Xanthomonas citri pv. glycines]
MMVSPSVTVARPTSSAALTGKTKTTSNNIQRFNNLNSHFLSKSADRAPRVLPCCHYSRSAWSSVPSNLTSAPATTASVAAGTVCQSIRDAYSFSSFFVRASDVHAQKRGKRRVGTQDSDHANK